MKFMLAIAASALALSATSAKADDDSDIRSYLATGRTFDCSVDNFGLLSSEDSQDPKARVYVETGGIGVIILMDLMVDNAGARYRFGSEIEMTGEVANFDVSGTTRDKTGQLSSGASWPFLRGEFALQLGSPASLHGVLKNSAGDQIDLYCSEG